MSLVDLYTHMCVYIYRTCRLADRAYVFKVKIQSTTIITRAYIFAEGAGLKGRGCLRGPFSTAVYPCVSVQRANNASRTRKQGLKKIITLTSTYVRFHFSVSFSIQDNVDPDLHFSTERAQLKTSCMCTTVRREVAFT